MSSREGFQYDSLSNRRLVIPPIDTGVQVQTSNLSTKEIITTIEQSNGLIPFSEFMRIALLGIDGYYSKGKVKLGKNKDSDFITSPEVSPFFGYCIGIASKKIWENTGSPNTFHIIEIGGGTGALAHDLMMWAQLHEPEFYKHLHYTLLDYGNMADVQATNLTLESAKGHKERLNGVSFARGSALRLPFKNVDGVFISNELLDTFPCDVLTRINGQIYQKNVGIRGGNWVEQWGNPRKELLEFVNKYDIQLHEGVEEPVQLQVPKYFEEIGKSLRSGGVITFDYGAFGESGQIDKYPMRTFGQEKKEIDRKNTYKNKRSEVYSDIGKKDITSNVNFKTVVLCAEDAGMSLSKFGIQKNFLIENGLFEFGFSEINHALGQANQTDLHRLYIHGNHTNRNVIGLVSRNLGYGLGRINYTVHTKN